MPVVSSTLVAVPLSDERGCVRVFSGCVLGPELEEVEVGGNGGGCGVMGELSEGNPEKLLL